MAITTYQTIPETVEAIQITGDVTNLQEIAEFTGESFTLGLVQGNIDDWVIKKPSGEISVMTDVQFQLNYQ